MKYRELTPNEIEAYNIGYKNGSRQAVIKVLEYETPEERQFYRQGYNAGCQDRKRHNVKTCEIGSNVSNVSNVKSYDSGVSGESCDSVIVNNNTITDTIVSNKESIGGMGGKREKINEDTHFYAGGQMWVFPFEFRALAQKYWTDETIREIEKSFSCQEKDTEVSIKMLLEQYPSDQIDIDVEFEKFWNAYTPVKTTDGRAVNKGSRKETFVKYSRIIKSGVKPADILKGLNAYLTDCRNNNRFTCGATVFLNQERWKDEYNTPVIVAQQTMAMTARERQDLINKQKTEALLKTMREKGMLE